MSTTPFYKPAFHYGRFHRKHVKWSIACAQSIFDVMGIKLVVHKSESTMPKSRRAFSDVHYAKHTLHIVNDDQSFIGSIWHEVGHALAADSESLNGTNWCSPLPRHLRGKPPKEHRSFDNRLEEEACAATFFILNELGAPKRMIAYAMYVVNVLDGENLKASSRIRSRVKRFAKIAFGG